MEDRFVHDNKPLTGKRILITRSKEQASAMATAIEQLGGEAVTIPVINIVPVRSRAGKASIELALSELLSYDWIVFTSPNGVRYFFSYMEEYQLNRQILDTCKIAAVGPKTAAGLQQNGVHVHETPKAFHAEALTKWLKERCNPNDRVLLARGNLARSYLPEELEKFGLDVTDLTVYETVMPDSETSRKLLKKLASVEIDWITFTSSSTVEHLIQMLAVHTDTPVNVINKSRVACIGPITAATAKKNGIRVDCVAKTYTVEAMLQEIIEGGKK